MRISDWSSDVCSSDLHVPGSIGEDRAIVIAVRRRNVAAPDLRLEAVLAHQPPDFLMVDDDALVPERGPHAAVSVGLRSEEHTSELQSLMRISYAVFCLKKKKTNTHHKTQHKLRQY